ELWTGVHWLITRADDDLAVLKRLAHIGRYGWRYVIDIALPQLHPERVIMLGTPSPGNVAEMFTCLYLMAYTSELSNTLHFFSTQLRGTEITYAPRAEEIIRVVYPEEGGERIEEIARYVLEGGTSRRYPVLHQYNQDDSDTVRRLSHFLQNHYGFDF